MRSIMFLFSGIIAGLYLSWPGILSFKNWKCFNDIVAKSSEDKIPIKVVLELSPSDLINSNNKTKPTKIRIVADACFR